jgi:hypothetical protein
MFDIDASSSHERADKPDKASVSEADHRLVDAIGR